MKEPKISILYLIIVAHKNWYKSKFYLFYFDLYYNYFIFISTLFLKKKL